MISRRKTILTIILSVFLVVAFMVVTLAANRLIFADKVRTRDAKKLEAINRMLEDLSSSLSDAERNAAEQYEVNATLTATALGHVIANENDNAVALYQNGAVVKTENGGITAPGSVSRDLGLTASLFEEGKGVFPSPANSSTLVAYSRIGESPYYYLEWYEDTVLADLVESTVNLGGILEEAEAAYGSMILLVKNDGASESGMTVFYRNSDFAAYDSTGEMGLTSEEIEQSVGRPAQSFSLNGTAYRYSVGEIPSVNGYAILLIPETDIIRQSFDQIGGLVSILILILAGMVGTGLSLYGYALKNTPASGRKKRYRPAFVKRAAAVYGITGLLFMGISSSCLYSLNGLHEAAVNGGEALEMLQKRIVLNISRDSYGAKTTIDSYIKNGEHISEILTHYPQLLDGALLEELSKCIQASSITLYDHTGKEIVSSGGYIDMVLGTDAESTTYDFRRILKGVPYIVHEAEKDETTGLTQVRIGIRTGDAETPGKYGVMLISLDPAVIEQAATDRIDSTLRYMSEEETMLWIAENGSGTILAASDSGLTGRDIYSIGMGQNDLAEGMMKNIYLENGKYFVMSSLLSDPVIAEGAEKYNNSVAYYAVSKAAANYGIIYTVANCCVLFAVIYAFLAWFILREYTDEFYEKCKSINEAAVKATAEASVEKAKAGRPSRLWRHLFGPGSFWDTRRPEQKGLIIMEAFLSLFLLQQIPILSNIEKSQNSLYYYIFKGVWERGINLFAIARIMILAGEMILIVLIVSFVLQFIGRQLGAKGWTVCRLVINVIKYLSIASFIGLSLYYLGMDKTTLLAALSILSLAVSLGSQSLVADIIAGISIIMEGVFDVGDYVEIGSHSGKVLEIGVRTTRILCPGNDIMVIGNKEISTVINKSRRNTVFSVPIIIQTDYQLDSIREILERELPEIGARNSIILSGPTFEGLTKIKNGRMTLSIAAECRQADVGKAKLYLTSELQKLFTRNGIRI